MINALLILFLVLSVVIIKCGFEMYRYLLNQGELNSTNSLQEQMGFIPIYINSTSEKTGKVGIWFKILVSALVMQVIIFFVLVFVLES